MYCSKCGKEIRDGAKFCGSCGAPVKKRSIESYMQAVELALAGDEKGFSYLYGQTYKSKYYLVMKYMGSREEAEDVLQDAYIKAFSKLDTLKEPETFPSWLGTILANTAKNALQKKTPVLFSDLPSGDAETDLPDFEIEDESPDYQPEAAYTRQETEELVREMIGSLSEEQKMCILMYYIDGESVRDIAEALDCSESAVKSRLSYGRKNLKAKAEEMQKKGYRLFTLAPIPLLLALVYNDAEAAVCEEEFAAAGRRIAEDVLKKTPQIAKGAATALNAGTGAAASQAGTGTATPQAGAGTAAKAAAGAGTAGNGGIGAGAAAGFISTTGGKVVIFVAAAVVAIGGVGGGVHVHRVNQSIEEAVVYADESMSEEPEQSGVDDTGTGTAPGPVDDASGSETDVEENVAEADALSASSVQGLLELFPYMADNLLYEYYNELGGNGSEFIKDGITNANQVYWLAAWAAFEQIEYMNYVDDTQFETRTIDGVGYKVLPTELYEKCLRDMFGSEYDISHFIETPGWVIRDSDGTFYSKVGDYGDDVVEVTLENISDTPDADGTYEALAKYSCYETGDDTAFHEYFMMYRVKPDESSDYGCVIVDMIPAGNGEVDVSALEEFSFDIEERKSDVSSVEYEIQHQNFSYYDDDDRLIADEQYALIVLSEANEACRSINNSLYEDYLQFKEMIQGNNAVYLELAKEYNYDLLSYHEVSADVVYNEGGYFCIMFGSKEYDPGDNGDHTEAYAVTFNLKTGEKMTISDLADMDDDDLVNIIKTKISEYASNDIQSDVVLDYINDVVDAFTLEDFQCGYTDSGHLVYYIQDGEIVVRVKQGSIGPYSFTTGSIPTGIIVNEA